MPDQIPPRPDDAMSGSSFMASVRDIMGDTLAPKLTSAEIERRRVRVEELVFQEMSRGNVPGFMRPENWREVRVEAKTGGKTVLAKVRVCPDYLAIGSDSDFVRIPLSPLTAQRIADKFGFSLPTARLVDVIDVAAKKVDGMLPFIAAPTIAKKIIDPSTGRSVESKWNYAKYGFYEGRWMLSAEFTAQQDKMITQAAHDAGDPPLRSGQKKDVIYDRLAIPSKEKGPRVVIYRKGVQGLSDIHEVTYHDYSHGIRFLESGVHLTITEKDGTKHEESMSLRDVLMHKEYHKLFVPAPIDISLMYRAAPPVPRKVHARPWRVAAPKVEFGQAELVGEKKRLQAH